MDSAKPDLEKRDRRVLLYGRHAHALDDLVAQYPNLHVVDDAPDVVVSYGGDGTLLASELRYPGLPKVPILNSHRGHRCIPHPADDVIGSLSEGALVANEYIKLDGKLYRDDGEEPAYQRTALNEFSVHMKRLNSAVRFKLWINDEPYEDGLEILGDGFLVCTPFGSTAYFSKLTRGVFTRGIGIAFKATSEPVSHLVLPESTVIRAVITRGPAVLVHDSAEDSLDLKEDDELVLSKHARGAIILTCGPVKRLDEPF